MLAINDVDRHSCSCAAIQRCVPLAPPRWQRAQHACLNLERPGSKSCKMDANPLVHSRKEPTTVKVFKASPPGPRRHDPSVRAAGPSPSHTLQTPFLTPLTYAARLVPPTRPQMPRSQHSDSWTHPLSHIANAALTPPTYVACLGEIEGPRQLRTSPQIRVWSSGPATQSFFGVLRPSYSQCIPNFAFDGSATASPDLIGGCYTTARLPAMGSAFRETYVT